MTASSRLLGLTALGRHCVTEALATFVSGAFLHGGEQDAPQTLLCVDATCGNGHDTLFLADLLGRLLPGENAAVMAFDVQEAALDATKTLLDKESTGRNVRVSLLLRSHAELAAAQDELAPGSALCAVMYNLGFLPRSDKQVTTRSESTLASLKAAKERLVHGGIIALHAYGGHKGGLEEMQAVTAWFSTLAYPAWQVGRYAICNKPRNPETLFLAHKR